ncbi:MAG: hypothetical protein QOC66_2001, partial [Pseudonocardiales bacterium]|nr:hypothetical protein [Pseudonocardiales bacterium]
MLSWYGERLPPADPSVEGPMDETTPTTGEPVNLVGTA